MDSSVFIQAPSFVNFASHFASLELKKATKLLILSLHSILLALGYILLKVSMIPAGTVEDCPWLTNVIEFRPISISHRYRFFICHNLVGNRDPAIIYRCPILPPHRPHSSFPPSG